MLKVRQYQKGQIVRVLYAGSRHAGHMGVVEVSSDYGILVRFKDGSWENYGFSKSLEPVGSLPSFNSVTPTVIKNGRRLS